MNENNECCIYCRVSTKDQDETIQIPACEQYAKELGLSVTDIVREKISAFKFINRASIKELLNYPHVIVFSYDRLFRDRKRFIETMRYFAIKGVKIHSVREKWLEQFHLVPRPWGEILFELMIQIVGWMSEDESQKKSERVKLAFNNKAEDLHWGRPWKEIDMDRLIKVYNQNSLRKTARTYNEIFKGKNRISYITVKKVVDKNPHLFNKRDANNQRVDLFTGALKGTFEGKQGEDMDSLPSPLLGCPTHSE